MISKLKSLAILVSFSTLTACHTVEEGSRGVQLVWGQAEKTPLSPGLYYARLLAHSFKDINVRERKFEQKTSASTKDQQMVDTVVAVNYSAKADKAVEIYSSLGDNPKNWDSTIVSPQIQEVLKSVTAKYTALELVTKREEVKDLVTAELTKRITKSNFTVISVAITDFQFSPTYMLSIEAKQVAEQDALRAQNELERNALEVKKIEQQAEADKAATISKAEGEAESLRIRAEAESAYHKKVGAAATKASVRILEIKKWDGVAPKYVGQAGMLLPAE